MIRADVIGNIGQDATLIQINGSNYIKFSVAHTEKVKDQSGNRVDQTTWVEILKKDNGGSLINWLKKGSRVFVSGKPRVNAFTTQSGTVKGSLTILANDLELLGGSTQGGQQEQQYSQAQTNAEPLQPQENKEDLPF